MFTNENPANVLTAKVPCACGTELYMQWNLDTWGLRSPIAVVCPGCTRRYELKVGQEKQHGGLEIATEVHSSTPVDAETISHQLAELARTRGAIA